MQKALADAGVASRRAAEELIRAGRVRVNGQVVSQLGTRVSEGDRLEVDGRPVRREVEPIYVLLNKPRGFVTTTSDPEGRRTVLDILPELGARVYPVGRLDYDTEGLLLLTNDGDLTNLLTHPRHRVLKTYLAEVEGSPSPVALETLARGVKLEDGYTSPARIRVQRRAEDRTTLSLTITEGRNRQVRRMLEVVGHPVLFLKRTRFGPLDLRGVKLGQWRFLSTAEVERLRRAVGPRGR